MARNKKLKSNMQEGCRKAYNFFINNKICDEMSTSPKNFWSFIKSKRCDNSSMAPLMKNGILHSDSESKANILNDQFTSVFTNEDTATLPGRSDQTMMLLTWQTT